MRNWNVDKPHVKTNTKVKVELRNVFLCKNVYGGLGFTSFETYSKDLKP